MIDFFLNYKGVDLVIVLVAYFIAIIFALSMHEYAHAKVAFNQGDYTPKAKGRLTLNPFKHIDPIGFICLMLVGFGWAKPVEVNPLNFKEYRKGFFCVSVAGVLTNFVLAFFSCGLLCLTQVIFGHLLTNTAGFVVYLYEFFVYLFACFTSINLCLGIFNLIPVYPLDGFNILQSFTKEGNRFVNFMTRYGNLILIALVIVDSVIETTTGVGLFNTVVNFFEVPLMKFWTTLIF